jgi:hypothetical protein
MTEPLPPIPTSTEPLAYRPISGWAIAGFATGCLFALVVVISAIVAFLQGGAPVFFPELTIGLAVVGIGLSLYGQRHVQTSEGTRAGADLARWGFRLNLISGLVYFSYYFVTAFALQSQANDFVMNKKDDDSGFFPRLIDGSSNPTEHNAAFLLTQAPNARGVRPENEAGLRERYDKPTREGTGGLLTQFREKELLSRILYKQLGKEAVITPQAVLNWGYDKNSYKIHRVYHIKTKEVEVEYALAVFSVEPEAAGQSRKWFVNLTLSGPKSIHLTPLGDGILRLRQGANEALAERLKELKKGKAFQDVEKFDRTGWEALIIPDGNWAERRSQFRAMLAGTGDLVIAIPDFPAYNAQPGRWEPVDGKIRMYPAVRIHLQKVAGILPVFQFEAIFTLETKQPVDPAKAMGSEEWNIVNVEVTAVNAIIPSSPLTKN